MGKVKWLAKTPELQNPMMTHMVFGLQWFVNRSSKHPLKDHSELVTPFYRSSNHPFYRMQTVSSFYRQSSYTYSGVKNCLSSSRLSSCLSTRLYLSLSVCPSVRLSLVLSYTYSCRYLINRSRYPHFHNLLESYFATRSSLLLTMLHKLPLLQLS